MLVTQPEVHNSLEKSSFSNHPARLISAGLLAASMCNIPAEAWQNYCGAKKQTLGCWVKETPLHQSSHNGITMAVNTPDWDLVKALNRIYEDLFANQVNLDTDTREILYANLWDLYE